MIVLLAYDEWKDGESNIILDYLLLFHDSQILFV